MAAALPDPPTWKAPPTGLANLDTGTSEPAEWRIDEDVIAGSVTVRTYEGGTTVHPGGRRSLYSNERLEMTAWYDDPARARLASDVVYRWTEETVSAEIRVHGTIWSTALDFHLDLALEVGLDGAPFWSRTWLETIPRRLV